MRVNRNVALAMLFLLAGTTRSFALPDLTSLSPTDPSLRGTTVAAETFTIDAIPDFWGGEAAPPLLPVICIDEKIVRNATGNLDFYFQLSNAGAAQSVRTFSLSFPNSIQASTVYLEDGNLAPTGGAVDSFSLGNPTYAGFSFGGDPVVGPLLGPGGTDTLLLRTDTNAFTSGQISLTRSLDDFDIQPGIALIPAASVVPEPTELALLSVALVGLMIRFRRR